MRLERLLSIIARPDRKCILSWPLSCVAQFSKSLKNLQSIRTSTYLYQLDNIYHRKFTSEIMTKKITNKTKNTRSKMVAAMSQFSFSDEVLSSWRATYTICRIAYNNRLLPFTIFLNIEEQVQISGSEFATSGDMLLVDDSSLSWTSSSWTMDLSTASPFIPWTMIRKTLDSHGGLGTFVWGNNQWKSKTVASWAPSPVHGWLQ